jgi:hypothetical protein
MQRKAFFAVVLLGLALWPISSGATAVCFSEDLAWLEAIVETPDPQDVPPLDLAAIGRGNAEDRAATRGRRNLKSLCTASCGTSTVSCTSSSSGTCTAVDRNCPTTPGYVVCDGTTTYCPACACTNGTKRYTQLSACCYNEVVRQCRRNLREETCVNGSWRVTAYSCDGLNCAGSCPV